MYSHFCIKLSIVVKTVYSLLIIQLITCCIYKPLLPWGGWIISLTNSYILLQASVRTHEVAG